MWGATSRLDSSDGEPGRSRSSLSPAKQALLERRLRRAREARPQPPPDTPLRPTTRAPGGDPPSYAQQRLWLLDALQPALTAYNVVRAVRLTGHLDVQALRVALGVVVSRHEALRSRIVNAVDGPRVVVAPPAPIPLDVTDLRGRPDSSEALDVALAAEANRPFDLSGDLLLRARLIRLADDCAVLVLSTHHVASDEASRAVLYTDLAAAYTAAVQGTAPALPRLPLQYADWAAWQRRRLAGPGMARHVDWWRDCLAGAPTELNLPSDLPAPAAPDFSGARYLDHVNAEQSLAVTELTRRHGVTLFTTILAGFAALVNRYSGMDDVVVGSPVSGRTPETAALIGCFSNLVPLRLRLDGNPTFGALLDRVRNTVTETLAHADVPFERLVEELSAGRDPARNPLFQTAVSVERGTDALPRLPGLQVEAVDVAPSQAKLELALITDDQGPTGMRLEWEYNTRRFDPVTVARLSASLRHLLAQVVEVPRTRLSDLTLPPVEEAQVTVWGAPSGPAARPASLPTLPSRLAAQARRRPRAPAVSGPDGNLSYADLVAASGAVAQRLVELGVAPGDRVAVCLDRSAALVVALLGVLEAAAAYVPVDSTYPPDRIRGMLADAEVTAVVTSTSVLDRLPRTVLPDCDRRLVLDGPLERWAPAGEQATGGGPSGTDAAYVIYTSGSTGTPKGVVVEHRSVSNLLESMAREPGMSEADALLAVTTPSFDIAALELFLPLWVGGRVTVAAAADTAVPERLAGLLDSTGATLMQATPATWQLLIDAGWAGRRRLRALCGGEALSAGLAGRLIERCAELWNLYGPTETTIWSTACRVTSTDLDPLPLGRPIAGTRLYVVDGFDRLAPVGVPGELLIAGRGVARGYWRRPELTAERFVTLPVTGGRRAYRTGDRVRWRADGRLEYLGRLDAQVKLRGHRVELGEVEAVLRAQLGVTEAAVVRREDRPGDARLVAYVTGAGHVDPAALRQQLGARLPAYMVPARLVVLERLPRTPNGKVDRAALPAPAEPVETAEPVEAAELAPGRTDRTPTEAAVAGWWRELLGVEPSSPGDDFFDLGGHSLLLVALAARARHEYGVALPLRHLYERSSFAGMSEILSSELLTAEPGDVEELLAALGGTGEA